MKGRVPPERTNVGSRSTMKKGASGVSSDAMDIRE